jgi:hypothetical protein
MAMHTAEYRMSHMVLPLWWCLLGKGEKERAEKE